MIGTRSLQVILWLLVFGHAIQTQGHNDGYEDTSGPDVVLESTLPHTPTLTPSLSTDSSPKLSPTSSTSPSGSHRATDTTNPSETPTSSTSPRPSKTSTSSTSPRPSETSTSSTSPRPSETSTPSTSPRPSETSTSSTSPRPSETSTPSTSPRPSETSTSSTSPRPSETSTSSTSPRPSETPTPSGNPSTNQSPSDTPAPSDTSFTDPKPSTTQTSSGTSTPSSNPSPSNTPTPSTNPSTSNTPTPPTASQYSTSKSTTSRYTTPDTTEGTTPNQTTAETSTKKPDCCVDKEFIRGLEGFSRNGYVPMEDGKPLGHSGVTIGNGIDLGTKDRKYFEDLGVDEATIDKLEPYFGLKGQDAVDKLASDPLTLDEDVARDLSDKVMDKELEEVEEEYNDAIGDGKLEWCDLTTSQRTVIASVLFQYGSPQKVPTFWKHVTNQDWEKAIEELRDFKDKYPTRRGKEADYLEDDKGADMDTDGC